MKLLVLALVVLAVVYVEAGPNSGCRVCKNDSKYNCLMTNKVLCEHNEKYCYNRAIKMPNEDDYRFWYGCSRTCNDHRPQGWREAVGARDMVHMYQCWPK